MADDNWRDLLDDEEVYAIIRRAVRGYGAAKYAPTGLHALVYDDLESLLFDRAVDIAIAYPGPTAPVGDPARGEWHGYLVTALHTEIDHAFGRTSGKKGTAKRVAHVRGVASVEAITARNDAGEGPALDALMDHRDGMWWHPLTHDDPLTIAMRREHLARLLRLAESKARSVGYAYSTETTVDVMCREPLCRSLAVTRGWCRLHYERDLALWGRSDGTTTTCAFTGCTLLATARGMCQRHYEQEWRRRRRDDDPWPAAHVPECEVDGCERPASSSKASTCKAHGDAARDHARALELLGDVLHHIAYNPCCTQKQLEARFGEKVARAALTRLTADGAVTVELVKPQGRGRPSRVYTALVRSEVSP